MRWSGRRVAAAARAREGAGGVMHHVLRRDLAAPRAVGGKNSLSTHTLHEIRTYRPSDNATRVPGLTRRLQASNCSLAPPYFTGVVRLRLPHTGAAGGYFRRYFPAGPHTPGGAAALSCTDATAAPHGRLLCAAGSGT